ncbi:MAG TPA: type II and III secretion system protein family protein [Rhodopila sp.]|nr:type II and III secretion system protein family protein [Rhodopila sp.]
MNHFLRLPVLLVSLTALTAPMATAETAGLPLPAALSVQPAPVRPVASEALQGQPRPQLPASNMQAPFGTAVNRAAVAQAGAATVDTSHAQTITIEAGTGVLLTLPRPASSILSAEPTIARVQPASPTSLFLMGVSAGHTTVIATAENGTSIAQFDVTVIGGKAAAAPAPAPPPLAALLPGAGGPGGGDTTISAATARQIETAIHRLMPGGTSVHANAIGSRILLSGAVPNPAAAEQAEAIARGYAGDHAVIVPTLTVLSSIQVNVRVRIAEISRTVERQLGFNWQALNNSANFRFGFLTGAAASATGFSPLQPLGLTNAPNQLGAGFKTGNWDVNAIIDALATDQLVTILAEPNLTAQSGEPASFLAGGEFPVPIAGNTSSGATTITVEFKQYGVSLEVVPTVLSEGRLNLRVRPEVSELTTNGAVSVPIGNSTLTIPALVVRRAETTVELGSGQSFAIAGLLEKTSTDATSGIPGAADLPVLGALFKSNDFQRGESELVIIVTPYLVKPVNGPEQLKLPTDGFRPATDLDRILLGRQVRQPDGAPLNAGYILK